MVVLVSHFGYKRVCLHGGAVNERLSGSKTDWFQSALCNYGISERTSFVSIFSHFYIYCAICNITNIINLLLYTNIIKFLIWLLFRSRIYEVNHVENLYDDLMNLIVRFAQYGVIHGDFNEFNIMINNEEKPIVIDFPQMMSVSHPNAQMWVYVFSV